MNPDEFYAFKPTLAKGFHPILQKKLGTKEFKLVYEEGGTRQTRTVPVSRDDRDRFVLSEDDILTLARWAVLVEEHYSRAGLAVTDGYRVGQGWPERRAVSRAGTARDGAHTARPAGALERVHLEARGDVLTKGRSVGEKIGQGPARIIQSATDLEQLQQGGH